MENLTNENHISTYVSKDIDKTNLNEFKENHNENINHNPPHSSPIINKNMMLDSCDLENIFIKDPEKKLLNSTPKNFNDEELVCNI